MRTLLLVALLIGLCAIPAAADGVAAAGAQDMPTRPSATPPPTVYGPAWFLELGAGTGFTQANSFRYHDLVGTAFTTNPVSGVEIFPSNIVNTGNSPVATMALGRFLTDNVYFKGVYHYFGKYNASGFAAFPPGGNFQQVQWSTANGAFLGLGFIYDSTSNFFWDASGEFGAAFVRSGGEHDANLFPQSFPYNSNINLAVGAGLGLGYRITPNIDLMLTGNYYYLGNALTGITCHCIPGTAGEHASERLSAKLDVIPILVRLRFKW